MRKVLMSDGKKKVLEKKNKFLRWENKFCTFFCSILMNLTFITALAALHITEKGFARCGLLQTESGEEDETLAKTFSIF